MKRCHVRLAVENLAASVSFCSALFAAEPAVLKPDYAKWMLQDPRVNFAISQRGPTPGLEQVGIQVEDQAELEEVHGKPKRAECPVLEEGEAARCYANSGKGWISDPQSVLWETFLTIGESTVYGRDVLMPVTTMKPACCAPSKGSMGAVGAQRSKCGH